MAARCIFADERLGGFRQLVLGDPATVMQVPDEVRESVVFLYSRQDFGMVPRGTAFFVAVAAGDESQPLMRGWDGHAYLVTARHLIDGIRTKGIDGKVYARVNMRDGDVAMVISDVSEWRPTPNEVTDRQAESGEPSELIDVSVLAWGQTQESIAYRPVPTVPMFVTDETVAMKQIGLGDNVFMTGLFVFHSGKQRNVPIVRIGTIAAMSGEPVETKLGSMVAYLIESRSVGGLSGSPVFVEIDPLRSISVDPIGGIVRTGTHQSSRQFYLLGMVHGHWDTEFVVSDPAYPEDQLVNMGIAIVVPSQKILEVMNMPKLVAERREGEAAKRQAHLPTADMADAKPSEFRRFEKLTKGLMRVSKEDLDAERKAEKENPENW
ncbi:MAG: hypothetical protein WA751_06880 [Candidatus Dormiibacterota bacterium]